ncbi:hypothetical protein ABE530_05690, partial [Brucella sp. TWI559]
SCPMQVSRVSTADRTIATEKAKAEEVDTHPPPFLVCNSDQPLGMGAERQHLSHLYFAGNVATLTC